MPGLLVAALWISAGIGTGMIAVGVATLTRHQVLPVWLRGFVKWRRWGWTQVAGGIGLLLITMPPLAHTSEPLSWILGAVAVVALIVGRVLDRGADLPRVPTQRTGR